MFFFVLATFALFAAAGLWVKTAATLVTLAMIMSPQTAIEMIWTFLFQPSSDEGFASWALLIASCVWTFALARALIVGRRV